jgi:hypothetical protein
MQFNPLLNARAQGVLIPESQSTEAAPTMKVTKIARMEPVLLEWGNERGQKETSVAFVVGDKVYVPPQYAMWTSGFRPLVEALNRQAIDMLDLADAQSRPAAAMPSKDVVDVTGKGAK